MTKAPHKTRPKLDNAEQSRAFIETARKLGCDEDKERFEKSLGKIAAYKPPKKPPSEPMKPKTKKPGQ